MADTRLHSRADAQADQFDRHAGVGNVLMEMEAVTCARRLSQLVVRIAGVVEGGRMRGKYRSHGPVLPVSMMQRDL